MCKENTITEKMIDELIQDKAFIKMFDKTTVCCIKLKNGFEIIELNDGTFEFLNHDYSIKIKYVHQLQNLYYALQNEELSLSGI